MKRIWFNHWFSTAYRFIEFLKRDTDNYVIVSNERSTCAQQAVADEFFIEPVMDNENDYLIWCLDFCMAHKINVFFPRRNASVISAHVNKFEAVGVRVIIEPNKEIHSLLNSKIKSCEYMKMNNLCDVPEMFLASNKIEFMTAYNKLTSIYGEEYPVCIKKDVDEGGLSFKKVLPRRNHLAYNEIYISDAAALIESDNAPYVVMPYLEGPEISIDCLRTPDGLISVPRIKESNRVTRLCFNDELISIASKINANLQISYPYNIQLRHLGEKLMFMEINLRLSGGAYKDIAVECNFPQLAIDVAYKTPIDYSKIFSARKDKRLVSIEDFAEI